MKTHRFLVMIFAGALITGLALRSSAQSIAMTIDAGKTGAPISRLMYSYFSEPATTQLWGEMLSDRKFFYPVNSKEEPAPTDRRGFGRRIVRWRPIGPDEFVSMDREHAYVGEHSPVIKLEGATPHGIQQAGLGLRKARKYSGRIILAGQPGAEVKVSLVWGAAPGDRQTIPIRSLRSEYVKFPLSFIAEGDSDDGRIEIVGTGKGSFEIGAVSLMPADNLNGYRADLIALLKQLDPGMIRWPGGDFVSQYDWRDGIGDPDKRPPRYDYAWKSLESNDVGVDDYMALNKLLGMEPYICVNSGFGDAYSAAQLVEYVNGSANTPMGKWRAANGHPEPYKEIWWNIGNEMYNPPQLGRMTLPNYVIKHNMMAQAMRKVDPSIKLVASGATPATMWYARENGKAQGLTPPAIYRAEGEPGVLPDWTGGLFEKSSDYLDAIAEHLYTRPESPFDPERKEYVPEENESAMDSMRRTPNRLRLAIDAWADYQQRFPVFKERFIPIALDEWTSSRTTLAPGGSFFSALTAAETLNEMFRYSNLFLMSVYTGATGCLAITKTDAVMRPNGLMFQIYRKHFGTLPVAVTGNSPQHPVRGTVGIDVPKVLSGGGTYPLDVEAALTADKKALTLAVVNPSDTPQQAQVTVAGVALQPTGHVWRIAGRDITVTNEVGKPPAVEIVENSVNGGLNKVEVPPLSISVYEFPVQ